MSYDPDSELERLARENMSVFFYPSCGKDSSRFNRYDCCIYIFSDSLDRRERNKEGRKDFWESFKKNLGCDVTVIAETVCTRVFRYGDKWGFLFFQDNNVVLTRIRNSGLKISCFCSVCCGCMDGGNYECVNNRRFLTKIFALMHHDGMQYITDHSNILADHSTVNHLSRYEHQLSFYKELVFRDKHFICQGEPQQTRIFASDYYDSIHNELYVLASETQYKVEQHIPSKFLWKNDKLQVTIEHDNLVKHSQSLDGYMISRLCNTIHRNRFPEERTHFVPTSFFKPSISSANNFSTESSIRLILQKSLENKWDVVGTTAFGEGKHDGILEVLNQWEGEYPKWIRIFHIDKDDFLDLKQYFKKL